MPSGVLPALLFYLKLPRSLSLAAIETDHVRLRSTRAASTNAPVHPPGSYPGHPVLQTNVAEYLVSGLAMLVRIEFAFTHQLVKRIVYEGSTHETGRVERRSARSIPGVLSVDGQQALTGQFDNSGDARSFLNLRLYLAGLLQAVLPQAAFLVWGS